MRKKIVAGNWKMNLDKAEALSLTTDLVDALGALPEINVSWFVPRVFI